VPSRRKAALAILLAGLAGAAFVGTRRATPASGEENAVIAAVQQNIATAKAAADERERTLAEMKPLVSALSTDAVTMHDLQKSELTLQPQPGEVVEIGQRFKGGQTNSLLRMPGDAEPLPLSPDGSRLVVVGGRLTLIETVAVKPVERADELTGVISVARAVDLSAAKAAAARLGRVALSDTRTSLLLTTNAPVAAISTTAVENRSGPWELLVEAPRLPPWLAAIIAGATVFVALLLWRKPAGEPVASRAAATANENAAPAASAAPAAGVKTIGRYEILRSLGSGGMADVYLAKATGEAGFEKRFALKVLNAASSADPVAVEHFLDEARLAANLAHPNVVQIADLGRAGDAYFIAMEFVDGSDLERLLDDCRQRREWVPTAIALNLLGQICTGLHAAHQAHTVDGRPLGIVHRDVKSANVFVAKNGVVKIGDFGIAKAQETVRKTQVGIVKGTAEYMAPEQRVGGEVDARADQYAVGAIAYEIFSGQLINLDLAKLAHLGARGWPHLTPLPQLRPDLPPELGDVVFKALSYSRADRYASCEALAEAFGAIAQKHGLTVGERGVVQWLAERLPLRSGKTAREVAG
jgi:tRNA A-37 threonylcarbamoyl transferase component Bud32